jgi:hypothetical protein
MPGGILKENNQISVLRRAGILFFVFAGMVLMSSCSEELIVVDGNPPYSTFNVSDIKIENYVNRLYIDIIGREPLDHELVVEVERLKTGGLKRETRDSIIYTLMTDTTYRENEFSYKAAYVQNLYNLAKVRCLEGAADSEIQLRINILKNGALVDSLEGNWDAFYQKQNEIRRNEDALKSRQALYDGLIAYHQVYSFMIDNGVYDIINMNSFNFIRASFDQLIWRLPTQQEFEHGFNMVEYNQTAELFGTLGSNKNDYIRILTSSNEMLEGMLIWCYQVFLSRPPTAGEVVTLLPTYINDKDINWVIAQILVTDEYANFR